MKINEVVSEGVVSSAFKGLAKGVGSALAPDAVKDFYKADYHEKGLDLPSILPRGQQGDEEPAAKPAAKPTIGATGKRVAPSPDEPAKPFTIKLDSGSVTRNEYGEWVTSQGVTVNDPKILTKLDAYADQGITDVAAYQASLAQKDAEMRARIAARAKQYEPVDVSRPTQQPIKIGKEVIQPSDPRYAKLAARIK